MILYKNIDCLGKLITHAQTESFLDPDTRTMTYVVHAGPGSPCIVIDLVLDYDPESGRTTICSTDRVVAFIEVWGLCTEWLLKTHAHADHLSAVLYLRGHFGKRIAIDEHTRVVQGVFKSIFDFERAFLPDGSQFDHLFMSDKAFRIGNLEVKALAVPGRAPADIAYQMDDTVLVGGTLFMPDVGTTRYDFPGGDTGTLYQSIRRLLDLPLDTRLYICHNYPPGGRETVYRAMVAEQRHTNIYVRDGVTEAKLVQVRTKCDTTLGMPTLILPAIQVNIRVGTLPPAESSGVQYLKIPLNAL